MRRLIEELTTLIGDLTELARDEPALFSLEEIDLAEITERAVQRVRRRASSLQFDLHAEPWWVTGDSAALERAVTNLLDNAAKWSPPLGTVTVRLEHGSLLVADQGHGIPETDQPRVFDRFYRGPNDEIGRGAGIGLALTADLIRAHDGRFDVQSSPGRGTTLSTSASIRPSRWTTPT